MSTTTLNPQDELRQLAGLILEFVESSDLNLAALIKPQGLTEKEVRHAAAGKYDELSASAILDQVKAITAQIGGAGEADPLYEDMSTAKQVRAAFSRLRLSNTKAKLLIVEGQTGMGKTSAGEIISAKMRDLNATAAIYTIEASAAWRGRSGPMMNAMLAALGMPHKSRSNESKLEKLVESLTNGLRPSSLTRSMTAAWTCCARSRRCSIARRPRSFCSLTRSSSVIWKMKPGTMSASSPATDSLHESTSGE